VSTTVSDVTQSPLRIMIIDDSDEVRSALAGVIDGQSDLLCVAVAGGVDEGVRLVLEHEPDVVILDVSMPDGGGLRAAKELTAWAPQTKIVAFSAFDKPLITKAMTAAGAVSYISKSASLPELLAAIRETRTPTAP